MMTTPSGEGDERENFERLQATSRPELPAAGFPPAFVLCPKPEEAPTPAVEDLLHQTFEAQAARDPEAVALACDGREVRYGELNRWAEVLALRLREAGARPGALIGLCAERSPEMVAGILGILKSGGAYVPLDPAYPSERLGWMLADARPEIVLVQEATREVLPRHEGVKWVAMEPNALCAPPEPARGGGATAGPEGKAGSTAAGPDSLAYVIYTSGSTGRPKGVMVRHRNVVHSTWARRRYYAEPVRSFLLLSSFSFDSSVAGLFWTLSQGGKLVLPRPGMEREITHLLALIAEQGVSHLLCVPALYDLLLVQARRGQLESVRTVVVAGEVCPAPLARRHHERLPGARFFNEYGPTEATVWCTVYESRPDHVVEKIPIGRPIDGAQVFLLDDTLEPVAPGVAGEVYVGGTGVASGYLNRPDLTAERFVRPSWAGANSERLYKTGDLARLLPDGNLEFLGRLDHQVKLRGYRIELGEIEAVLRRHPEVGEAAVVLREDTPGDKRLWAYVVVRPGAAASTSELRGHLAKHLPEPLLPSGYTVLSSLPLSPNGKVDRGALPPPSQERPDLAQAYVAPRTEVERYLAGLWRGVLRLDRVGVHDKFFELGGNSLQAAVVIQQLQDKLGEFIFVVAIFEAPSIAEFAAFLAKNYPAAVGRLFPRAEGQTLAVGREHDRPITPEMVAEARRLLQRPSSAASATARKNPPALFILSPPRSGTTLLRVMLAGHPRLFAASELQLLGFETLQERKAAFAGKYSLWLEGTLRVLMELHHCDAEAAARMMEEWEQRNASTQAFYGWLQRGLGDRWLVDKSPSYALDPEALRRAERDFESPRYIHLVRHPAAMIRSFAQNHMDQVYFTAAHAFSGREVAELVWLISHQNCLNFLKDVPLKRQVHLRFKDLVQQPRAAMETVCGTFGLPFHPDMLEPYKNPEKKMLDGLHPQSKAMGDPKFHEYRGIEAKVAEMGSPTVANSVLSDSTWKLAEELGYARPAGVGAEETPTGPNAGRGARARRNRQYLQQRQQAMKSFQAGRREKDSGYG